MMAHRLLWHCEYCGASGELVVLLDAHDVDEPSRRIAIAHDAHQAARDNACTFGLNASVRVLRVETAH